MRRYDLVLGLAAFLTLALAMPLALFEPVDAGCAAGTHMCGRAA